MSKIAITAGLMALVSGNDHIEHVWFDKNGEWTLQADRLHPIKMTREEVLGAEVSDEAGAGSTSTSDKPAKVADLIAQILTAESADDIDAIVGEDKRATVLAAADKAKAALATQ